MLFSDIRCAVVRRLRSGVPAPQTGIRYARSAERETDDACELPIPLTSLSVVCADALDRRLIEWLRSSVRRWCDSVGDGCGVGPVGCAEFCEDVRDVDAGGLGTDEQVGGDLAVGVA